jgi:hypothetical protein
VRRPGFAAVVTVTLALGLGANVTIFSLMNGVFLRPVPGVERPDGIVELYGSGSPHASAGAFRGYLPMSWPTLQDVTEQSETLAAVYVYAIWPTSLAAQGEAERVMTGFVSANYFDVLGTRPSLGRTFSPDEGVPGAGAAVAVLGHVFWRRRFGADPTIVGRTISLNARTYTVVGVAPEGFLGTSTVFGPDLWAPLPMVQDVPIWGDLWENRAVRMFLAGGRIADGRALADVAAELASVGARIADAHPQQVRERTILAVPLAQASVRTSGDRCSVPGPCSWRSSRSSW